MGGIVSRVVNREQRNDLSMISDLRNMQGEIESLHDECTVLNVEVVEANVMPMDSNGLSDPYCKIEHNGITAQSQIRFKTLNPRWEFSAKFVENRSRRILVTVWDNDMIGTDDLIGECEPEIPELGGVSDKWYRLTSPEATKPGTIRVRVIHEWGGSSYWLNNLMDKILLSRYGECPRQVRNKPELLPEDVLENGENSTASPGPPPTPGSKMAWLQRKTAKKSFGGTDSPLANTPKAENGGGFLKDDKEDESNNNNKEHEISVTSNIGGIDDKNSSSSTHDGSMNDNNNNDHNHNNNNNNHRLEGLREEGESARSSKHDDASSKSETFPQQHHQQPSFTAVSPMFSTISSIGDHSGADNLSTSSSQQHHKPALPPLPPPPSSSSHHHPTFSAPPPPSVGSLSVAAPSSAASQASVSSQNSLPPIPPSPRLVAVSG